MAPFDAVESKHSKRMRDLLRAIICVSLALNVVILISQRFFADAMAKSQINLVQGQATLREDVADVKKDVGVSMMASLAAESAAEDALDESKKMHADLLNQMKVVKDKTIVATKATLATHAKVSQKILTGADAEAVRRRESLADQKIKQAEKIKQDKHSTVIKIFPWQ